MNSIVNEANLKAGINYWLTEKPHWPKDFHNEFYHQLHQLQKDGLDRAWWCAIVEHLSGWRANRPFSKVVIYKKGLPYLQELETLYNDIICQPQLKSLTLDTLTWNDVRPLYHKAKLIKNVQSPVFGSKLCHFILPNAYPVVDQDAVGIRTNDYSDYWRNCKFMWQHCSDKNRLQSILSDAVGRRLERDYPWSTKITEICWIGSRQI